MTERLVLIISRDGDGWRVAASYPGGDYHEHGRCEWAAVHGFVEEALASYRALEDANDDE